jgi:hypothetical protein
MFLITGGDRTTLRHDAEKRSLDLYRHENFQSLSSRRMGIILKNKLNSFSLWGIDVVPLYPLYSKCVTEDSTNLMKACFCTFFKNSVYT